MMQKELSNSFLLRHLSSKENENRETPWNAASAKITCVEMTTSNNLAKM